MRLISTPQALPPRRPGTHPRCWWPSILVALLILQVTMSGLVFYLANSDRTFAIEPEYYAKALGWDANRAEDRVAASQGWSAVLTVAERPGEDGHEVCVRLANAEGAPLRAAAVAAEVFHHRNARERRTLILKEHEAGGYRAGIRLDPPGLWEIRVRAACAGRVLRNRELVDVPAVKTE